ncbi:SprT family protein [Lactococcus nasutitermitis]|uniref:SprT family protein n=1 Tax=Lactococcus nasutitermitis TaxID=1652957 RepID=A0ABV9JGX4_9LACT|nr:SprT family protein [Lactococcus nasutitermitis]
MNNDHSVKNSDDNLTAYVQQLSLENFGWEFKHKAIWNNHLRSTGGRFFPKDNHLDFNPKMAELPDFDKIILHELVHYHLYQQKRGYKHADKDFKQLLAQVGGLRYAPNLSTSKLIYSCQQCGQIYPRQRKINTQKYRCGRCHGKLQLKYF